LNLQSDDFELLGLERAFALNLSVLDARRRELQTQVHPDRFAAQGQAAQRLALQWAVRVNEAYQRLKDPLKRATYLCELNGEALQAETNTAMPTAFLMRQMEWREQLDEARTPTQVEVLALQVQAYQTQALTELGHTLDGAQDFAGAAHQIRELMFVERLLHDVQQRLEFLET
jgi:molecular chaperone HscB